MESPPEMAPVGAADDTCLTRPLILAAVLVMAGHQIHGTPHSRSVHPVPHLEEVSHHG